MVVFAGLVHHGFERPVARVFAHARSGLFGKRARGAAG
jgi:hypothetical protein